MKYREALNHECVYEGTSYDEIITKMKADSPCPDFTNYEYMAVICVGMGKSTTTDPEEFIKVMLISGFIEFCK